MQSNNKLKTILLCTLVSLSPILTLSSPGRGQSLPRTRSGGEGQQLASAFAYQLALPGRKLSFPADHYSHPDFKTEWWYYTGHLETENGKRYGYQITFFRFGVRDRQKELKEQPLFTELYMAHFALSDLAAKKFIFRERINRGYGDKAGAATDRYLVWNEDWKVEGDARNHSIDVKDRETQLRLSVKSQKPPVLHGQNGLSQKGEGEG
ncbi:MAG TPA: carotenoid 1,2-hydratase, partial [Candidatus Binatia bacterium]